MNFSDPSNMFEWIVYIANEYKYMFLEGLWITLYIAVIGTLVGFIVGYLVGMVQDIKINKQDNLIKRILMRTLKIICIVYVEVFRGTPMIVQGMIVYYGLLQANVKISPIFAGILVTVLNTGAYMAETVRGGINSVDKGQKEGAWSLGMSPMLTMFRVVLPQAFKNVVPEINGKHIPYKPQDDICLKCYWCFRAVPCCKDSWWYILQVFRIIPRNCSYLFCTLLRTESSFPLARKEACKEEGLCACS